MGPTKDININIWNVFNQINSYLQSPSFLSDK